MYYLFLVLSTIASTRGLSLRNEVSLLSQNKQDLTSKMMNICECNEAGPNLCVDCKAEFSLKNKNPNVKSIWVVVSENMHGFLKASLKCNRALVDEIIVITSPSDVEAQKLCVEQGIYCHVTAALHANGDSFNKGRALKEVQQFLHNTEEDVSNSTQTALRPQCKDKQCLLFLVDNDICLPPNLWEQLPSSLHEGTLYTETKRCLFENPEDYSRGYPAVEEHAPYPTMGFFQMYVSSPNAPLYDDIYTSADMSDLMFSKKFDQTEKVDIYPSHMGDTGKYWHGFTANSSDWAFAASPPSGACSCCANWDNGQKKKRFWNKGGRRRGTTPMNK